MDEPDKLLNPALGIIRSQMTELNQCGLLEAASYCEAGINGGLESLMWAKMFVPTKFKRTLHGLKCRNECRSILMLEKWLPEHEDWYVLYFHSKGATHPADHGFSTTWRKCMMRGVIANWRTCIADLDAGYDAVGSHWMEPPATPEGHYIFAGTFWWARARFLRTLPSIMERDRIKVSGIDSIDSRYEAEVWLGNGPIKPKIKDYHGPNWNPSKIATCKI
jgi:hypothetical protein